MNNSLRNKDQKKLIRGKKPQNFSKKKLNQLKKQGPKALNLQFNDLHDKEFETMDCLSCANCCKTTSPIFRNADINRIAKHLREKAGNFTEKYLKN